VIAAVVAARQARERRHAEGEDDEPEVPSTAVG
jgi:hypothetical protein